MEVRWNLDCASDISGEEGRRVDRVACETVPEFVVDFCGPRRVFLATKTQALSDGDGILTGLHRAVARGREEGMSCISKLGDAATVRRPLLDRIAPAEAPVDDFLGNLLKEIDDGWIPVVGFFIKLLDANLGVAKIVPGLCDIAVTLSD